MEAFRINKQESLVEIKTEKQDVKIKVTATQSVPFDRIWAFEGTGQQECPRLMVTPERAKGIHKLQY